MPDNDPIPAGRPGASARNASTPLSPMRVVAFMMVGMLLATTLRGSAPATNTPLGYTAWVKMAQGLLEPCVTASSTAGAALASYENAATPSRSELALRTASQGMSDACGALLGTGAGPGTPTGYGSTYWLATSWAAINEVTLARDLAAIGTTHGSGVSLAHYDADANLANVREGVVLSSLSSHAGASYSVSTGLKLYSWATFA
jgi:hypothetical protein